MQAQWAGSWNAGATRIRVTIESWGPDCGPRPQNATVPGAGQVRITERGDHLVVHGRSERRTDGCWSENRAVRRVSSSHQEGVWRTTCRTPRNDPRAETGSYTLRANGDDRLEFTDRSNYDWQLNESRCVATMRASQVFTRVGGGTTRPDPPEPTPATCTPGAAARLRLRPAEAEIEPGERLRLRAAVVDTNGCALTGQTIRWELRRPEGVTGELRNGVFTAGDTAAAAEGEFVVTAHAGELEAAAQLVVRTPDLSDLIARRTGGGIVQAQDDDDATAESAAGVSARAEEAEEGTGWVWPAVGVSAVVLLLLIAAFVVLLRRRPAIPEVPDDEPEVAPAPATGGSALGSAAPIPNARPPSGGPPTGPGPMVCPVCGAEYADPAKTFCEKDGSRLAAPAAGPEAPPGRALICPTCRRGFPVGTRSCPTDGKELMPYALFVERHKAQAAEGVALAKICPKCGDRYARQVTFCGKDGAELVLVN